MCVSVRGWEIRLPWQQPDYNCPGVALIPPPTPPFHPSQLALFTANQGTSNLSSFKCDFTNRGRREGGRELMKHQQIKQWIAPRRNTLTSPETTNHQVSPEDSTWRCGSPLTPIGRRNTNVAICGSKGPLHTDRSEPRSTPRSVFVLLCLRQILGS